MENSQPLATDSFSYGWLINNKPSFDGLLESLRPSLDISSNIDTMPMVNHLNKILKDDQEFDFNVHPDADGSSRFSISLVHADEIFSDGCIKSVSIINPPDRKKSLPAAPVVYSSTSSSAAAPDGSICQNQGLDYSVHKCKKMAPGKVWQRCYGLLRPIYRGLGCSRASVRVDDLDRKVLEVRSRSNSVQASPDRRSKLDALGKQKSSGTVLDVLEVGINSVLRASPERRNWAVLKKSRSSVCERLITSPPQVSPARSPNHYNSTEASESSIHEAILHCKRSFAN